MTRTQKRALVIATYVYASAEWAASGVVKDMIQPAFQAWIEQLEAASEPLPLPGTFENSVWPAVTQALCNLRERDLRIELASLAKIREEAGAKLDSGPDLSLGF